MGESIWPILTIKRKNGEKTESVKVFKDADGAIHFKGVLRNPVEVDELITFLKQTLVNPEIAVRWEPEYEEAFRKKYFCDCGSNKTHPVANLIIHWGPSSKTKYDVFKCEACGRFIETETITVYDY